MEQYYTRSGLPVFTRREEDRSHGAIEHAAMNVLTGAGIAGAGLAVLPIIGGLFPSTSGAGVASALTFSWCGLGATGWAEGAQGMVKAIPGVGETLAAGGWAAIGASAGLVLGGLMLGKYIDERTPKGGFPWGSVVRWGLLATSALIAAPMILSGVSMGLMFLSNLLPAAGAIGGALSAAAATVGTVGASAMLPASTMAATGAGMSMLHALTCLLPLGLFGFLSTQKKEEVAGVPPQLILPERALDGRLVSLQQAPTHAA